MLAEEMVILDTDENYALVIVTKIHGMGRKTINFHDLDSVSEV